jgi:hypothetical protein
MIYDRFRAPLTLVDALPDRHEATTRLARVVSVGNGTVDVAPIGSSVVFHDIQLTGDAAPAVGDIVTIQTVRGVKTALVRSYTSGSAGSGTTVVSGTSTGTSGSTYTPPAGLAGSGLTWTTYPTVMAARAASTKVSVNTSGIDVSPTNIFAAMTTSNLSEGTNLYWTSSRVSGTAPISYNSGTGAFSLSLATTSG